MLDHSQELGSDFLIHKRQEVGNSVISDILKYLWPFSLLSAALERVRHRYIFSARYFLNLTGYSRSVIYIHSFNFNFVTCERTSMLVQVLHASSKLHHLPLVS